jgi:MFS family permease
MSFELISFHFAQTGTVSKQWIPVFFSLAMATNAVASLIFGRLYDRLGFPIVIVAVVLSSIFAPFVFLGNYAIALVGMIFWGIGFGAQDTLLKAIIAGLLPEGRRNLAFGLFYTGYGTGWLIGSVTTGFLYNESITLVIAFSVVVQLEILQQVVDEFFSGGGLFLFDSVDESDSLNDVG